MKQTIAVINDEIFDAVVFEIEYGGFAHSFLFFSNFFKLKHCSFVESTVEKCFSAGGLDANMLSLLQNVEVLFNKKKGRISPLNLIWKLSPAIDWRTHSLPVFIAIAGVGNIGEGAVEIAQIRSPLWWRLFQAKRQFYLFTPNRAKRL